MKVLVTVGSTGFDDLVDSAISAEFLSKLYDLGYQHLTIQYGSSESIYHDRIGRLDMVSGRTPVIEGYKYKSDIKQDMMYADLIISHAGKRNHKWHARTDIGHNIRVFVQVLDQF
jgi:UDP-N-acetylglucosamine transferase subunit ALG13